MTTGILAIVCIILIFVLYLVSGGWRKYGGFLGIFKWLRSGALNGAMNPRQGTSNHVSARGTKPSTSSDDHAVQVLREIYEEFDRRNQALAMRVDALERALKSVQASVASATSVTTEPAPLTNADSSVPIHARDERGVSQMNYRGDDTSSSRSAEKIPVERSEETYFAILDLLEAGKRVEEIVDMLHVTEQDVLYVQQIMGRS